MISCSNILVNSAECYPISFTLKLDKLRNFLLQIKTVEWYSKMLNLNIHALYSDLTVRGAFNNLST